MYSLHTRKLRPHLQRSTEEDTTEDAGLEQVRPLLSALSTLKLDSLPNLSVLELDELGVGVSVAVNIGQDHESLVVAVVVHEPTGGFGEPGHAERENQTRNELQAPGDTERGDTIDVRATELDKVLQETGVCVSSCVQSRVGRRTFPM